MSDLNELLPAGRRKSRPGTKVFWGLVVLAIIGIVACLAGIKPQYRASTLVQVDDSIRTAPMSLERPLVPVEQMERRVADQIIMLTSDNVIEETLKSSDVTQTRWYQDGKARAGGDVSRLVDTLKRNLNAQPIPRSNHFQVTFRAEDPNDAAQVLNTAISKYLAHVEAKSQLMVRREWEEYRSQTAEKLNQLRSRREACRQFAATQFRSPGVFLGLNVPAETFRVLSDKVEALEMEKLQHRARYDNLKSMAPEALQALPEIIQVVESNPRVQWLRQEILARQVDLSAAGGEENASAPKGLRSRLQALQEKLSAVVAEAAKHEGDRLLKSAETDYLNATQAELQMRERMEVAMAVVSDTDMKMPEYEAIKSEVEQLEKEYKHLNAFTNQLGILQAMGGGGGVRQIGTARPPTEKDHSVALARAVGIGAVPLAYGILLIVARALSGIGFIQIDTGRIGGITPAKKVADYAAAKGVTYVNHTFTTPLALNASIQPFAGLKDHVICEYPLEAKPVARDLTTTPIARDANGQVNVPDAPGLGMQVNMETVKKYLVDVEITANKNVLYRTPQP